MALRREWLELRVRCPAEAVDAVSDALAEITGCGVSIEDPSLPARARAEGRWDLDDLPAGSAAGGDVVVLGYLSPARSRADAIARLDERLAGIAAAGLGRPRLVGERAVADADWAEQWKRHFKPTRIGRAIVVVPSWERYAAKPGDVVLDLDPGMAFGTGTHATTRLCLEALEAELAAPGRGPAAAARGSIAAGPRVLDVGCGSGILAIAALRLGAGDAVAIDTDPLAVGVTRENARRNGVDRRLQAFHGDLDAWLAGRPPAAAAPFDVIVANIVADPIIAIAPAAFALLRPGGAFIAGGIIEPRAEQVRAALRAAGFDPVESRADGGWTTFVARRRT